MIINFFFYTYTANIIRKAETIFENFNEVYFVNFIYSYSRKGNINKDHFEVDQLIQLMNGLRNRNFVNSSLVF